MKYILSALSFFYFAGICSISVHAADKPLNMSVYLSTPDYLAIIDTKLVQKLTSREGRLKLKNIKPYHQLQELFESRILNQPALTNYPINKQLFNNWEPEITFGFGGPAIKYESIKQLKTELDNPAVKYIIVMTPGIKFVSRVSATDNAYYGNGLIYDSTTTKLFSSNLLCVIDLDTESTLDCERFFSTVLFTSNNSISSERLAEIKEYIELDITDESIVEKINLLLAKNDTSLLNTGELKQLYTDGLQHSNFSLDDIVDRTNYLMELINLPVEAVKASSLPELETSITNQLIDMLNNKLPATIDSLIIYTANHITDDF